MDKIKKLNTVYGEPSLNMVHLRFLMLKTNGNDHNGKDRRFMGLN